MNSVTRLNYFWKVTQLFYDLCDSFEKQYLLNFWGYLLVVELFEKIGLLSSPTSGHTAFQMLKTWVAQLFYDAWDSWKTTPFKLLRWQVGQLFEKIGLHSIPSSGADPINKIWSKIYTANFRALFLVEILEQPIRMLKNLHSIILCWKYFYMFEPQVTMVTSKPWTR